MFILNKRFKRTYSALETLNPVDNMWEDAKLIFRASQIYGRAD